MSFWSATRDSSTDLISISEFFAYLQKIVKIFLPTVLTTGGYVGTWGIVWIIKKFFSMRLRINLRADFHYSIRSDMRRMEEVRRLSKKFCLHLQVGRKEALISFAEKIFNVFMIGRGTK